MSDDSDSDVPAYIAVLQESGTVPVASLPRASAPGVGPLPAVAVAVAAVHVAPTDSSRRPAAAATEGVAPAAAAAPAVRGEDSYHSTSDDDVPAYMTVLAGDPSAAFGADKGAGDDKLAPLLVYASAAEPLPSDYVSPLVSYHTAPAHRRRRRNNGPEPPMSLPPSQLLLPTVAAGGSDGKLSAGIATAVSLGFPAHASAWGAAVTSASSSAGAGGAGGGGDDHGDGGDDRLLQITVYTSAGLRGDEFHRRRVLLCSIAIMIPVQILFACIIFFVAPYSKDAGGDSTFDTLALIGTGAGLVALVAVLYIQSPLLIGLFVMAFALDGFINIIRFVNVAHFLSVMCQLSLCYAAALFASTAQPAWTELRPAT